MPKSPSIKAFNFAELPKVSRAELDLFKALRRRYPWLASEKGLATLESSLSQVLGQATRLSSQSVKTLSLADFLSQSAAKSLVAQVRRGEDELLWLRLDPSLLGQVLASVLGDKLPPSTGSIGDLEKGLLEFCLLKALDWAKQGLADDQPWELQDWGLYEEGLARPAGDSSVCVFSFLLSMNKVSAYAWVALSHPTVEGLLLGDSPWESQELPSLEPSLERVGHLKAKVWPEIGRVTLSSEEQGALEVGDVILFDESDLRLSAHGLSGKARIRVEDNLSEGLLAEVLDSGATVSLKLLEYDGGWQDYGD